MFHFQENLFQQTYVTKVQDDNIFVTPIPPRKGSSRRRTDRKVFNRPHHDNRNINFQHHPEPPRDVTRRRPAGQTSSNRNVGKRLKRKEEALQKLFEIAGDGSTGSAGSAPGSVAKEPEKDFECPYDGHFGDDSDCTKFYRCAHGKAQADYCPGGLFWNSGKCSLSSFCSNIVF